GAPTALLAKNSDYVVGVAFRLKIKQQRRVSVGPQSSGGEDCAFQAMRCLFGEDPPRRPGRIGQVVGSIIEKLLDTVWILHPAQLPHFARSEAEDVRVHRCW